MIRIGLLSDTHAYWDDRYQIYFNSCDEVWHAGDIGSDEVADKFEQFKPFRAVYGNIDSYAMRLRYPQFQRFTVEGADILMTHIGGYPEKYDRQVIPMFYKHAPNLFISGHSHILKVEYDRRFNMLHINPGAAGKYGLHTKRTLIRFSIDEGTFKDLEVIELS